MKPRNLHTILSGTIVVASSLFIAQGCDVEDSDESVADAEIDSDAESFEDLEDNDDESNFRVWTGITSEEYPPLTCTSGNFARGFECFGSKCDNIRMDCHLAGATHGAHSWSSYFSEEGTGSADERHCASGEFVTGIACSGSFCDNISIRCTKAVGKTFGSCSWSGWYSEEHGPFTAPSGNYIKGIECDGSNCDNKRYHHCKMISG